MRPRTDGLHAATFRAGDTGMRLSSPQAHSTLRLAFGSQHMPA